MLTILSLPMHYINFTFTLIVQFTATKYTLMLFLYSLIIDASKVTLNCP
jgi:hypothetical protein